MDDLWPDTPEEERELRREKIEQLKMLLGMAPDVGEGEEIPPSTVKSRREDLGLTQVQLARESGLSQSLIAAIEAGERKLTRDAAQKLAVPLSLKASDLAMAEEVSALGRAAEAGKLDPYRLVDSIMEFSRTTEDEDDELYDQLTDALLMILQRAVETHASTRGATEVSTKSADTRRRRRDASGYALEKPHQPESQRIMQNHPERDAEGKKIRKPFDPPDRR